MTKQTFIALADAVREMRPLALSEIGQAQRAQWEYMRDKLADFCQSQNPRFMRALWIGYVNGENGPNPKRTRK